MHVVSFDGRPDPMPAFDAPCVERGFPGGTTFVHGYSGRDAARWVEVARMLAPAPSEPTERHRQIAQVLDVCRTAPGSEARTFQVPMNQQLARKAAEALEAGLPGPWIEMVCRESDAISLRDYVPLSTAEPGRDRKLGDLLADDEFWAVMDWLSTQLDGVPLRENGRPLGQVLSRANRDLDWRNRLLGVVGDLAAMAAGG